MELYEIITSKDKRAFLNFIYKIYRGNTHFKDVQVSITKQFLYNRDTFTKSCIIKPICIKENNNIIAQCILIYHKDFPYVQLSFFESIEHKNEAVVMLINYAKEMAKQLKITKIVVGLHGHVAYGVGLLSNHFDKDISFDSIYSLPYYNNYFSQYPSKTLHSYSFNMDEVLFNEKLMQRVEEKFTFRKVNLKDFKNEMMLFGRLCNETLNSTTYYFNRDPYAMFELMKEMKFLLKDSYILFALKEGKEVGFIFWHPDFNEIIPGGKKNSIITIGVNFLLKLKNIKTLKINSIGVLPQYQNSMIYGALVYKAKQLVSPNITKAETNFVWDENGKSASAIKHLSGKPFRKYHTYEIDVS